VDKMWFRNYFFLQPLQSGFKAYSSKILADFLVARKRSYWLIKSADIAI
jgi:hypothetical protein